MLRMHTQLALQLRDVGAAGDEHELRAAVDIARLRFRMHRDHAAGMTGMLAVVHAGVLSTGGSATAAAVSGVCRVIMTARLGARGQRAHLAVMIVVHGPHGGDALAQIGNVTRCDEDEGRTRVGVLDRDRRARDGDGTGRIARRCVTSAH